MTYYVKLLIFIVKNMELSEVRHHKIDEVWRGPVELLTVDPVADLWVVDGV
mgnify:CR=1 FL=1